MDEAAGPVNVLVVDDHAENRLAIKAILEGPEYEVVEADSSSRAFLQLLEREFAVLLIDVVMPGMNGFELAAAIKDRERTAAVPIIFLTAEATNLTQIYRGYRAGAVDYLITPLIPEMVRAKVAVFAELYRQRKRIERQAALLVEAERRESELRLMELRLASERRYRSLAESVPLVIWTASPAGQIDYFNQRWFERTGLTREQAGGTWVTALHPDDQDACGQGWFEALRSGRVFQGECRLRCGPEGEFRWHLCRAVPEKGAGGQIVSWLGTLTDIDDQKRVQEVLAEFKGTLDAVLDAVLIIEPDDFRFRYLNQGAEILLGYRAEELASMRLFELMTDFDEARLRERLAPLQEGAAGSIFLETRCARKDGREIPAEFSFQFIRSDGGHIVSIGRDITDRKLAELEREHLYAEAVSAIHARDEFLSIASHELRTPLSSLQLQVEILRRRDDLSEQHTKEKLDVMARLIDRLSRLIAELMDVSRLTTGGLRLEIERIDLSSLACDVIARFKEDAARAGSEIRVDAPDPVIGSWDALRMEQVLTNLLGNALKFGGGKPVEVRVTMAGGRADLVVQDHGIGIAAEDVERVFERFERARSASSYSGLGLGLYIVRQIVEAHGGTIRVESRPGAGSTFTVELPLEHQPKRGDVRPLSGEELESAERAKHGGGATEGSAGR